MADPQTTSTARRASVVTSPISRREALGALGVVGAGALTLPRWVEALTRVAHARAATGLQAAATAWRPTVLSAAQNQTVITLTELIIPRTDTAGAADARVNEFIDTVLADADEAERDTFLGGLEWLDARSTELFGASFDQVATGQQVALLTILASPDNQTPADRVGVELFAAVKSLTVTGYYTSQIGMREELGDDGRFSFREKLGCQHPEHKG